MVNVESSFKATEGFMANWKGSIKDGIHLHGPVSLNYCNEKITTISFIHNIADNTSKV